MKHVNMFHEKDMLLNKFSYELSKKQKKQWSKRNNDNNNKK